MDKGKNKGKVTAFIMNHWRKFCAGFVVLLILLCILIKIKDGYNYISALANVVIATSAVMAYLTARNYLPQLTTQEGYKIAIHMVNNELQSTSVISDSIFAAKNMDVFLKKLDGKNASDADNKKLNQDIIKFNKVILNAKQYEQSINHYVSTMKTYGLEPAPDRKVYFDGFRQSLNQINIALHEIKIILPLFENYHKSIIPPSFAIQSTLFKYNYIKDRYIKINDALSSIDSAYNALNSNRLSFFGEKRQIGKLFVVNQD